MSVVIAAGLCTCLPAGHVFTCPCARPGVAVPVARVGVTRRRHERRRSSKRRRPSDSERNQPARGVARGDQRAGHQRPSYVVRAPFLTPFRSVCRGRLRGNTRRAPSDTTRRTCRPSEPFAATNLCFVVFEFTLRFNVCARARFTGDAQCLFEKLWIMLFVGD